MPGRVLLPARICFLEIRLLRPDPLLRLRKPGVLHRVGWISHPLPMSPLRLGHRPKFTLLHQILLLLLHHVLLLAFSVEYASRSNVPMVR
jgi:hypothetical protein